MRFPLSRIWSALLLSLGAAVAAGCGDGEPVVRLTPNGEGGAGGAPHSDDGGEPSSDPRPAAGAAGDAGAAGEPAVSEECGTLDLAALGAASWDPRFTIAGVTGHDGITPTVYDFAVEPDGALLATGRFAYHEGKAVPPLLRLRDGAWQPAHASWTVPPPDDGFAALAVGEDGVLALATADSFGDRDGEIWLDRDDEQQVVARFTGQVRTLAWFRGELYVAGAFSLAEELGGVENLAVWDGEAWSAPRGGEADGPVLELLVAGTSLYVGGAFGSVGGIESANVAVFDGESWSPRPLPDALAVYALARSDEGELYAGGVLGALDAPSGVMKLVGDEWQVLGGGVSQFGTRGVVSDLSLHDGVLDVAGCFSSAGGLPESGGAVKAEGLARYDGTQWQSLNTSSGTSSPWFQPGVCGDEGLSALWDMEYQRLGFHEGKLFAGGSFAGVEGVQSQSLSVYDEGEWRAQGKGGPGLGGSLDRVVAGGPRCELYGLGGFTHLGGKAQAGRVARFDGSAWHLLTDDLPGDAYCPALDVSQDGELALACMVFSDDGGARGVLLTRDGERLVPRELDQALPPLQAARWDRNGRLWLAGGDAAGFVATLTGDELRFLEKEFDAPVQFLDVTDPDDVVAAGTFNHVGDAPARRIARYQGGAWSALGEGLVGQPQAIARDADHVYASTYDEGQGALLLGVFDGERWSERAGGKSGLAVEEFYSFNQILPIPSGLLLVGTAQLQSGAGRGALLWQDGKLQPLGGGGVHGILVGGVALAPRSVWIGGVIAEVSDGAETISSVGVARLAW